MASPQIAGPWGYCGALGTNLTVVPGYADNWSNARKRIARRGDEVSDLGLVLLAG